MSRAQKNYERYLGFQKNVGYQISDKISVWAKDEVEGYVRGEVQKEAGGKYTLNFGDGSSKTVDKKETEPANPAKFDGAKDMSDLSHLNDATVLHNLRVRYDEDLIHTYSGLFLVVINPYKWIPIYTEEMIQLYQGRRRTEVYPHVFALADEAYRAMTRNRMNQSMLITGESGAGKTENTKKVIQYLATIAGKASSGGKLEQQILQANPMLEAFGNAKTNKNDNSSRFGKFIRVQFNAGGIICGTTIQVYLLEKSRVVHQGKGERNFHIFYQLLVGSTAEMKKDLHLMSANKVKYLEDNNSHKCRGMDDSKEFTDTCHAMTVVGVADAEQAAIFRVIAGIMLLGNVEYKSSYGSEGSQIVNADVVEKLSALWKLDKEKFAKALIKPKVKAGREIVEKHLNIEQAQYSRDAMCKAIYERVFLWLVKRLNRTLASDSEENFIGVLDIAGFEIFEHNSFEQLCINFTNEKLQQFFNHHMFKLEQEEYAREKIKWKFIDFGIDSKETIELIEKKSGGSVLSFLDEESIFPKATNQTLIQKLHGLAKHPKYAKVQFKKLAFKITHYAGDVEYDVSGWIDKNKDPLQKDLSTALQNSGDNFISSVFNDETLDSRAALALKKSNAAEASGKKKKSARAGSRTGGASFMTVATAYRDSLHDLMSTLEATEPHFIRCIIPNLKKKPGYLQADLVLEQLRCNGVLEGIRISRKGFPNRIKYQEFVQRYYLLHNTMKRNEPESKDATKKLMGYLKDIKNDLYQFGMTKIFFRHGVLAKLEEMREAKLSQMVVTIQAACRGWLGRSAFRKHGAQTAAARILQKNIKTWLSFNQWGWWQLFVKSKPLVTQVNVDDQMSELDARIEELEDAIATTEKERDTLKKKIADTEASLADVKDDLDAESAALKTAKASLTDLQEENEDLNSQLVDLERKADASGKERGTIGDDLKDLNEDLTATQDKLASAKKAVTALQASKKSNEDKIDEQNGKIDGLEDEVAKLKKQMAGLEDEIADLNDNLGAAGDKVSDLQRQKTRLEGDTEDTQTDLDDLNKEKDKLAKYIKDLSAQIEETQADLDAQLEQAKTIKAKNEDLNGRIGDANDELDATQKSISSLQKAKKKAEADIDDAELQLEEEQDAISAANKANKALDQEIKDLQAELDELEEDRENLEGKKRSNNAGLNDLKTKLDGLNSTIEKLKKQQSGLEADLADVQDEADEVSGLKGTLEKDKRKLEGDLRDAEEELEDATAQNTKLSKSKSKLDKEIKETNNRLADIQAATASLSAENNRLQAELAEAETEVEDMEKTNSAAERTLKTLKGQLEETKTELENEQDERIRAEKGQKTAQAALAEAKADIEELEETNASLEEQLRRKSAEAQELMARAAQEGMAAAKKKWSAASAKLRSELDSVLAELAEQESANRAAARALKKARSDVDTAKEINQQHELSTTKANEARKGAEKQLVDVRRDLDTVRNDASALLKELSSVQQELFALRDILRMAIQVSGEAVLLKRADQAPLTRSSIAVREEQREKNAERAAALKAPERAVASAPADEEPADDTPPPANNNADEESDEDSEN